MNQVRSKKSDFGFEHQNLREAQAIRPDSKGSESKVKFLKSIKSEGHVSI
ncbi:hypothetical protein A2U01_0026210 [Trifolium medium]|uniref:Uncharacterized protein n=1 Tax=Trifolium medium TaxID=97028 RepID=A0A392P0X3_9FABA|nr:hypothetical protein [Trifolium medium]